MCIYLWLVLQGVAKSPLYNSKHQNWPRLHHIGFQDPVQTVNWWFLGKKSRKLVAFVRDKTLPGSQKGGNQEKNTSKGKQILILGKLSCERILHGAHSCKHSWAIIKRFPVLSHQKRSRGAKQKNFKERGCNVQKVFSLWRKLQKSQWISWQKTQFKYNGRDLCNPKSNQFMWQFSFNHPVKCIIDTELFLLMTLHVV